MTSGNKDQVASFYELRDPIRLIKLNLEMKYGPGIKKQWEHRVRNVQ